MSSGQRGPILCCKRNQSCKLVVTDALNYSCKLNAKRKTIYKCMKLFFVIITCIINELADWPVKDSQLCE